jgi:hypothetical protein
MERDEQWPRRATKQCTCTCRLVHHRIAECALGWSLGVVHARIFRTKQLLAAYLGQDK